MRQEHYNHEEFLRRRLKRWKFQTPIGIICRRATTKIGIIFSLVSPRVAAVVFRTWLNGWCTGRRFQNPALKCQLACSPNADDSIEHYMRCPVVAGFSQACLHLDANTGDIAQSFMCLDKNEDDGTVVLRALLVYATYCATNGMRHSSARGSSLNMQELLLQHVHQGTYNHSCSQHVVSTMYNRRRTRLRTE